MHHLLRRLESHPELRQQVLGLARRTAEFSLVQGVTLKIDPVWLAMATTAVGGRRPASGPLIDALLDHWDAREALLVGAVLRQPTPGEKATSVEQASSVRSMLRESGLRGEVLFKPAPRLVGQACRGGEGRPGTIGGRLRDIDSDRIFAATAGHVVAHGPVESGRKPLGRCACSAEPYRLAPGERCTESCATPLDLALIDVTHSSGPPTGRSVADTEYTGDIVIMDGSASGRRRYEVGPAVVSYTLGGRCWKGGFITRPPPSPSILPLMLRAVFARPPRQGDSGSWLLRETDGAWCGVVVASDGLANGFALDAHTTVEEANSAFGMRLQPW